MTNLLLIEDADDLRETLAFLLEREGYDVRQAADGAAGLREFDDAEPDVVVLDLMIPEVPGIEVSRAIRRRSDVPIVMVTAKTGEADVVLGLESGADDYITKPFSTVELLARLRSILRRRRPDPDTGSVLDVGDISLDAERHEVVVAGTRVDMPLREFQLLELLMRNAGRVLPRSTLIDTIWGASYFGDTKTLDVHIRRLRAKIEPDPSRPSKLVTVRGVGYRLEE